MLNNPFSRGLRASVQRLLKMLTCCSLCFVAGSVAAQIETLNLSSSNFVVNSFPLNPYVPVLDGQWLGVTVASDGNCYFGSSTHDNKHGAAFFRYNPTNHVLTLLAEDLTRICGEDPTVTPPQGKLHSDIVEANGWLYFSTHLGNYWIEAETAYSGGHVLGYELATGKFRDFGVVLSNYTCYSAVGVDKVRNKILSYVTRWWGPTVDSHMFRIDIATGAKQDLGIVPGLNSFWFFMDPRGDCWFSCPYDNGSLRGVRSATGLIDTYPNVLPEPELGSARWWDWAYAVPGGDGNSCVFHLQGGNFLYTFNAAVFQTNAAGGITILRNTGPADSGLAMGPDRVYFIQRANRQSGNQEYTDFHLMSVPLAGGTPIIDHGLVADQSGRLIWRLPGMAADKHGRVYGVGDWWLLPGEEGTSVGTLRHVDDPGTNYTPLPRGEFFAVADLSQSPTLLASRWLSATTTGGGTITTDSPTNRFLGNAVVNLSAAPASGWSLLGWSGDVGYTNGNTNTIVTSRDTAVQAVFGTPLNTSINGNGSILLEPPGGLYPYGTVVHLTAVPPSGSYFTGWSGSTNSLLNPMDYPVLTPNATLTASFSPLLSNQFSVTVLINGAGQVTVTPQQPNYQANQNVTFVAHPAPGQSFQGWTGDASGTNINLSLVLNGSKVVTANFTQRPKLAIQHFLGSANGSSVELSFTGAIGVQYQIETSGDLVNWLPLGAFTNFFGTFTFTDPAATTDAVRFYRAVSLQ